MKKIVTLAVIATAMLTACNGEKLRDAEAQNEQLKGDLRETLATQDSLLVLVNDISDGMSQIKDLEKIISTPGSLGESASRKGQIKTRYATTSSPYSRLSRSVANALRNLKRNWLPAVRIQL